MSICSVGQMAYHQLHKHNYIEVQLPLSKSVANRVLMCTAIAGGDLSEIPLSTADDSVFFHEMLSDFRMGKTEFNARSGGTGFRFMLALLAASNGEYKLHASDQLLNRPHDELISILKNQGAEITTEANTYIIKGVSLKGGDIDVDISQSSQFLSALLMVGPLMKEAPVYKLSSQKVSFQYVRLTLQILQDFGIEYSCEGDLMKLKSAEFAQPDKKRSEKDWSSAAFWFELALLFPGLKFCFPGLKPDSSQPDSIASDYFAQLGLSVFEQNNLICSESKSCPSDKKVYDLEQSPDLFLPLVLACIGLKKECEFRGISHLVFKESDRVELLMENLENIGIKCRYYDPGVLFVPGNQDISEKEVVINHGDDHRMAMSFAILSLRFPQIKIPDMNCVSKSYPEFIQEFNTVKKLIVN